MYRIDRTADAIATKVARVFELAGIPGLDAAVTLRRAAAKLHAASERAPVGPAVLRELGLGAGAGGAPVRHRICGVAEEPAAGDL